MISKVLVPLPNDRVYADIDPKGFPQAIHQDVKDWLDANCPTGQFRESTYVDGRYLGETWWFSDANMAMRFKLTFL